MHTEPTIWGSFRLLGPHGESGRRFLGASATGERAVLERLDPGELQGCAPQFELLARLAHPYVTRLLERGTAPDGAPFLALQPPGSCDLQELLQRSPGRRLQPAEAVFVLDRCARGLAGLHEAGLLHRGLRPRNVFMDEGARLKLGRPCLEHPGPLGWWPPEVLAGGGWSPAADLWALGCVAHELLTGGHPFPSRGVTPPELLAQIQRGNRPPLPAETPLLLAQLVGRLLDLDPAARPSLAEVRYTLGSVASPAETWRVAKAWTQRLAPRPPQPSESGPDARRYDPNDATRAPGPARGLQNSSTSHEDVTPTAGPYRLLRRLGKGGMGEVWLGEHPQLGRHAIKLLPPGLQLDEDLVARFEQEVKTLARLGGHPGLVRVYATGGLEEGRPWFAMDHVPGETLYERVTKGGLPIEGALDALERVADALAFTHGQGFVHRDVKPDNVLVTPEGQVRLLDFGIAKLLAGASDGKGLTLSGEVLGTPNYMAPEQALPDRGPVGPWTDVFSLGAMLYELFAGRPPFEGATPIEVFLRLSKGDPPDPLPDRPELPPPLATLCFRALSMDPSERPQDAAAFLRELRTARLLPEPSRGWSAGLGLGLAIGGLCAGLAVALALALGGSQPEATDPAPTPSASSSTSEAPEPPLTPAQEQAQDWEAKARAAHQSGDLRQAESLLGRAIELEPTAGRLLSRGILRSRLQRREEALVDLERSLELDPDQPRAYGTLGAVLLDLGRPDEALAALDRSIQLDPTHARAYVNRASARRQGGEAAANLLDDLERAVELAPDDAVVRVKRGWAYMTLKRFDDARDDLLRALELCGSAPPAAEAHEFLGRIATDEGDLARALRRFEASLRLNPNNPVLILDRGRVHARSGDREAAIADFEQALRMVPTGEVAEQARAGLQVLGAR